MAPLHLQKLEVGDRVQHPFRVVDRVEKAKKDGEPFVILTLGNATGQIDTEPIWSNQLMLGWADGVQRGTVVQAIGNVARYESNGASKRQLRLSQPLRLLPAESVNLEEMLPRISRDVGELWEHLDRIRAEMRSTTLKRVLGHFFDDDAFRLRFEKTPGSISRHHARLGGLLLHIYEVTAFARTAAKAQRANVDLVTVGAMLHDVGKVESYDITVGGFQQTACGRLLGHIVLGSMMLERRLQEAVRKAATGEPICS